MPECTPETYIKANLSREEAEQLYELGREASVWAFLEFASQLKQAQGNDLPASGPNTPSSQIPVYEKPNAKTRRGKSEPKKGTRVKDVQSLKRSTRRRNIRLKFVPVAERLWERHSR